MTIDLGPGKLDQAQLPYHVNETSFISALKTIQIFTYDD